MNRRHIASPIGLAVTIAFVMSGVTPAAAQASAEEAAKREAEPKPLSPIEQERQRVNAVFAQLRSITPPERVIYGTDSRKDVYQETDPQLLQWAQSACVVVSTSELTNNGNGTYTLDTSPWTTVGGSTVCSDEPFRGQLQIGFCSGFLVGPDIVCTAGHCVSTSNCGTTAFVFGFDQQGPSTPPLTIVPAANVYFCAGIIDRQQAGDKDHCVARLDRAVTGRNPLPVRRTGSIANGDDVVMIGHPVVLPKKIDAGGECKNANGAVAWFNANVDAYGGNSGSMVINRVTGEIEGILVRGNPDFNTSSGCARSNVCPESGCPGWEEISKSTGFASFVPPLGLQVAPAGNVTMLGIVGGPFTNDPLVYTLSNPSGGAVDYEVSFVSGGSAPLLMDGGSGPLAGTLASGGSVMVSISTDPSTTSLPAGVYATTVSFRDVTNSRTESRVHTLEIGQTGIDVTPTTGFVSGGPVGGPFAATRTYTITSTRPTPVTVDVSASASWISLDGGTGPVMLSLSGIGDSEDIVVGFSSDALTLPAGIASGTVTFDNVEGALGDTTRAVTLDVGRYSYAPSDIPKPISDNQTITSTITVTDSYCIGDVDVELNITHTYIGDLIVELRSPLGTAVRLHNRTGGSADNIIRTYDDETTPPDPPATLAAFDGEQVTGVWTLTVSDNASQDVGALNAWTLKIAAGPPGCAAPEIIYEFPLNSSPGWSTTGQWAFGVPTGGGSANHDPTSGYTGSNVYGYNLSGDYANSIPEHYLTTTPIDLAGVTNTRLEFRRWLGIESSTYDHAAVQVSNNGVSWTTVWSHAGTSFSESAWSLQSYSIAAVADNQPAVRIRWVMGTTDSSVTYPGWNIDDVRIKGVPPPADCPGDTNGDRMVDNADLQAILDAWASMTGDPEYTDGADLNDDGTVDNFDLQELLDNWAQPCP